MVNGKITASVASNNITLAIKTIAGSDPSATDPVFIRIANNVRVLTAALSVTVNAGTNTMNLGAAEHATQDVDLFAYLVWKASNSTLVLGFSRLPYGRFYSDFSGTATAERYLAASATPASSDAAVNIGRFNATLSAAASYNWSIPATAIVVQFPCFETRYLTYVPTYTGFSANPTATVVYRITDHKCEIAYQTTGSGTSNATTFGVSVPIVGLSTGTTPLFYQFALVVDVGTFGDGVVNIDGTDSTKLQLRKTGLAAFTNSGNKSTYFLINYQMT